MRTLPPQALEDVIHGKVDVVFNGHVHAYERSEPVYHDKVTPASEGGITYITIGDGGNREGYAEPWVTPQPAWSALREFAYGFGELEVGKCVLVRMLRECMYE